MTTTIASPTLNREDLFQACGHIATHPNILDLFIGELNRAGFAGEERASRLTFLALTSRLFNKPVSIAVKGPSSAGKSHTTQQVLKFFPEEAYYALTAMSEKALAYTNESLQHRFVVIFEAEGMSGKTASYFIRSLLSEGCLNYDTVAKNPAGSFEKMKLRVDGPTGLLTTTTLVSLHPENETRLISIPTDDSSEQTARIMAEIALDESGEVVRAELDYAPWHAFQRMLGDGPRVVRVPFGGKLAKEIPAVAVRLRRDFGKLLTLIKAHALIHQESRPRSDDGSLIAILDDYAAVKALFGDLIAEAAEQSVSATIREAVQAIAAMREQRPGPVSVTALATYLGVHKSTASRHVDQAIEKGYLINMEDRKGYPAGLILGEALPEDQQILPEVEVLAA